MTMKKRFLGLALAAMVAVPATTAYADTTTVTGNETSPITHTVPVTGNILNAEGVAPQGKLTVELPTAMTFAVGSDSTVTGGTYNVSNKSSVPITLSVSEFRKANGDITVEESLNFEPENVDRSHVTLSLDGRVDNIPTFVDLGGFLSEDVSSEVEVLDVNANDTGSISLTGEAGTKKDESGVDTSGATGEFNLVFKITKNG